MIYLHKNFTTLATLNIYYKIDERFLSAEMELANVWIAVKTITKMINKTRAPMKSTIKLQ